MNYGYIKGTSEDYNGYEKTVFDFEGHRAEFTRPDVPAEGSKWIWRAEFPGAFDSVDVDMLRRGYYLVSVSVSDMYGCPESIKIFKDFYDFLTEKVGLNKKTILFGFSRGGLYSVNFALTHPECVEALYLDAPVLDMKSWPGGLGIGAGSPREWEDCMRLYGIDRSTALAFRGNPSDRVGELASLHIPVALVAGDSDMTVPYRENGMILENEYKRSGEKLLVILKPGCDHHPHSITDPTPVSEFLVSCKG